MDYLPGLSYVKVPIVTKNEFGGCEIEIAGVVISTPSATHLTAHHGSPLSFLCPFTSASLLRNAAHISRWGGAKSYDLCK